MNSPKFKVGDMVVVNGHQRKLWGSEEELVRGYKTYPGEYGYHGSIWVEPGCGVVLDAKKEFINVLIHSYFIWFEKHHLELVRNHEESL
jgi:hypothetical protein